MSRVFTDEGLLTWEVYASGGNFGLPTRPKVVFNCLSEMSRRARYVVVQGTEADAEEMVHESADERLRDMLRASKELEGGMI